MRLTRLLCVAPFLLLWFRAPATAALPPAGEYKGALIINRWINNPSGGDHILDYQKSYKATARIDANGYVRIVHKSPSFLPLVGRVQQETNGTLRFVSDTYSGFVEQKKGVFEFSLGRHSGVVPGPDDTKFDVEFFMLVRLKKVGK